MGAAAGLGLGVVMLVITHRELREAPRRGARSSDAALSIYLDLVAMSMQAGRGHCEALPAAAAIGSGWAFTELQDAIDGARFSGITAWHALGQLGERIGMPRADRPRRRTAAGQRRRRQGPGHPGRPRRHPPSRAHRRCRSCSATQATESMKFALIVMVFVFLAYELYPSVARLFAG